MSRRDLPAGRRAALRRRDFATVVAVALWSLLIAALFPAPAPTPPIVPYSLAHFR